MNTTLKSIEKEVEFNPNYLVDLRSKWEENKEYYSEEVVINLKKIANFVMKKNSTKEYIDSSYLHQLEDSGDVLQELIIFLYRKWENINKDATNKQIFNYLYTQVVYFFISRKRTTQKKLKKEFEKTKNSNPYSYYEHDFLVIDDPKIESFAKVILEEVDSMREPRALNNINKRRISKKLNISNKEYKVLVEKLKDHLKQGN